MKNNPACSDSILVGWVRMANFTNIRDGIVMTRAPLGLLDGFCTGLRILIFWGVIWSFKGKDYLSWIKNYFLGEKGVEWFLHPTLNFVKKIIGLILIILALAGGIFAGMQFKKEDPKEQLKEKPKEETNFKEKQFLYSKFEKPI